MFIKVYEMDDFINEINGYITWHNTKCIKQSLGYMNPVESRQFFD